MESELLSKFFLNYFYSNRKINKDIIIAFSSCVGNLRLRSLHAIATSSICSSTFRDLTITNNQKKKKKKWEGSVQPKEICSFIVA